MSYYAVANGLEIGIYRDWLSCKKNIINFPKARYKKFSTEDEAKEFIKNQSSSKEQISSSKDDIPQENNIYIFTDGACSNNGKHNAMAGIGIYFGEDDLRNVSKKIEGKQTNNTAELSAIIETLKIMKDELQNIVICSDSEYSIKSATYYGKNLKENDWKTSTNKIPPNIELVKELYELSQKSNISFKYVKAHTDSEDFFSNGNKMADKLANDAIGQQECPYNKQRMYLNVPYKEKDEAKSLGAKWCPSNKLWYCYNNSEELLKKYKK